MATMKKYYRVLFFIQGPVPTTAQQQEAMQYGPGCVFRNAHYIEPDTCLEDCDAVAGDIPAQYARTPRAVPIGEWYAKLAREAAKADAPAPFGAQSPPTASKLSQAPSEPLDPFRPPVPALEPPIEWTGNA